MKLRVLMPATIILLLMLFADYTIAGSVLIMVASYYYFRIWVNDIELLATASSRLRELQNGEKTPNTVVRLLEVFRQGYKKVIIYNLAGLMCLGLSLLIQRFMLPPDVVSIQRYILNAGLLVCQLLVLAKVFVSRYRLSNIIRKVTETIATLAQPQQDKQAAQQ